MRWQKKSFICSHETLDLKWYKRFTMVPLPYLLNEHCLRIFLTMCDEQNRGHIGYIDVNPDNPVEIMGYSEEPVLSPGVAGMFDDNGVVTADIIQHNDALYLYYSGYELGVQVPYTIYSGLAISLDGGEHFQRQTATPIMQRTDNEIFCRCAPYLLPEDDGYRIYYVGDHLDAWTGRPDSRKPVYTLKSFRSRSLGPWGPQEGEVCLELAPDGDEHGIAKATIWKDASVYKMIYSLRTLSKGYRLGYAESTDGSQFIRKDDQVGIDVSGEGFDADMICFPSRFVHKNKVYLFYCGNNYGLDGFGYAELVEG